jgi:hypothetical protein
MEKIVFHPMTKLSPSFAPSPQPAIKDLPDWWKDHSSHGNENEELTPEGFVLTVKKCVSVFDTLATGYILYCPTDIYIDATNPYYVEWQLPRVFSDKRDPHEVVAMHSQSQVANFPWDDDVYHREIFRIHPQWTIETPPGYSTLFMQPMNRGGSPLQHIPGIIDTDKFISNGHLSYRVKKGFKGIIKQGTPLTQVIPFKRDEWEMSLAPYEESVEKLDKQRVKIRATFKNGYKTKAWTRKVFK